MEVKTLLKKLIKIEFLKYKRSSMKFIPILVPMLFFLLLLLDFHLRKESIPPLIKEAFQVKENWKILFTESFYCNLWILSFPCVLVAMICISSRIENQGNCLKLILSRPVKRSSLLLCKVAVNSIFAACIIIFNIIGIAIAAKILKFPMDVSFGFIFIYIISQFAASAAILSLQQLLSIVFENELIPAVIGFVGILSSMMLYQGKLIRIFIPYCYFFNTAPNNDLSSLTQGIIISLIFTIICMGFSINIFNRKDVR
jgi:hypothetical protein